MKNYRQLIKELPSKSVVFAFGRFNPPTTGHELLVKAVKKLAQQRNADHVIFASRSQDAKKNPLSVDQKIKYLNLMFPHTNFAPATEQVRTFLEVAKLLNKRYKNIIMIAGSDRVPEYKRLLNAYNGKEFSFDTIDVVSAGERDPDSDDASGMSASKMRAFASKGDYSKFKQGLPSTMRDIDGRRLMNDVRQSMGFDPIKEQIVLPRDSKREQYFNGEIFNVGDLVESSGQHFTIVKRGSNHLLLRDESGNLVSKWIQDINITEEKQMNESLTDKTIKPTDKLKVARIIATMLGVENAESSSSAEQLVNTALRKVKTKSLNPEALSILDKMLALATETGIKYDSSLKPSKLKEQKLSKFSSKKDWREEPMSDQHNHNDSDHDYEHQVQVTDPSEVGHTLVRPGGQDNLRRRKVRYHLGEQKGPYEKESGHENTAQHIITNPEHGKKQKKLAKSFIDKMAGSVAESSEIQEANDHYEQAEHHKELAGTAKSKGDDFSYHMHMADHHGSMAEWHYSKGRDSIGDKHSDKAAHHEMRAHEIKSVKQEAVKPPTGDLKDACWKGYTAVGMKTKNGKKVPNCVPVKEESDIAEEVSVENLPEEPWEDHLFATEEPSDQDIDHFMNHLSDDEIYDLYDEEELTIVDDETGEELPEQPEESDLKEGALHEVLSRVERMKAKFRIRKTKAKRERATKISLKRYSDTKTINKRSRRLAIKLMKKRLLRGRDITKLSVGEKERIEKSLESRKPLINRIATKLVPRVRKIEKARLSHSKFTKGSVASVF